MQKFDEIDDLAVTNLRILSAEMIERAGSGIRDYHWVQRQCYGRCGVATYALIRNSHNGLTVIASSYRLDMVQRFSTACYI